MSEIVIPVKKMFNFASDIDLNTQTIKIKRRSYKQIEKLIELIWTQLSKAQMNGFEPSYVMLSWEDHAFLNAYIKYAPLYYYKTSPYGETVLKEIIGLKIIVSNVRKPKVGWEP